MSELFPSSFRTRLDRVTLAFRLSLSLPGEGRRHRAGLGQAREFAGHTPYAPGDEVRRIDWSVYGRLGKLFVKQFDPEREHELVIAPDLSRSMDVGDPSKRVVALRLSAMYLAAALRSGARVVLELPDATLSFEHLNDLASALAHMEAASSYRDDFFGILGRRWAERRKPVASAVLISDLMEAPVSLDRVLALGKARKLGCIGVLAPEEFRPTLQGEVELEDAEDGGVLRLSLGPVLMQKYGDALERHLQGWRSTCARHRATLEVVSADADVWELFMRRLSGNRVVG